MDRSHRSGRFSTTTQPDAKPLSRQVTECLEVWQEFLPLFPGDEQVPSFPIWTMEFGATYPYDETTPHEIGPARLGEFCGSHGTPLSLFAAEDRFARLPSYARTRQNKFPSWKVQFIRENRALYEKHWRVIDSWLSRLYQFPLSLQKLEWNCKGEVSDYIIGLHNQAAAALQSR